MFVAAPLMLGGQRLTIVCFRRNLEDVMRKLFISGLLLATLVASQSRAQTNPLWREEKVKKWGPSTLLSCWTAGKDRGL